MMKPLTCLAAALSAFVVIPAHAEEGEKGYVASAWDNVVRTYEQGGHELLIPTYTWHLPWAYSREKVKEYQNYPYGLGYGRGRFDGKGNYHGLFAIGFQDSHFKPEWMAGYSWKTYWPLGADFKGGLGFIAGVTTRSDYAHYAPVPFVLPAGSIERGRWSLDMTYVPGGKGNGNVVFFTNKWRFGAGS